MYNGIKQLRKSMAQSGNQVSYYCSGVQLRSGVSWEVAKMIHLVLD